MHFLLIIASILPFCLGGVVRPNVVQNFNASAYLGKWYEQEKSQNIFELVGKCVTAEYSLKDDGTVNVNNSYVWLDGATYSVGANAKIVSTTGEAKLQVIFETVPIPAPYWVVSTDYTSYAVVWSNLELFYDNLIWVLTREQNPPESVMQKVSEVLDENEITVGLTKTDQTSCN